MVQHLQYMHPNNLLIIELTQIEKSSCKMPLMIQLSLI